MERISIEINDYRVEGFEFSFNDDGLPLFNFIVGLYSPSGKKITTVKFSNQDVGFNFTPTNAMNDALRDVLIAADDWFESDFVPFIMEPSQE
jgi:hypothetical protein